MIIFGTFRGDRLTIRGSAMPHLMLSWQYALVAACALAIVAAVIKVGRLAGRPADRWAGWALWGGVARESVICPELSGQRICG